MLPCFLIHSFVEQLYTVLLVWTNFCLNIYDRDRIYLYIFKWMNIYHEIFWEEERNFILLLTNDKFYKYNWNKKLNYSSFKFQNIVSLRVKDIVLY